METRPSESDTERMDRIDSMVKAMVAAYGGGSESSILSLSYDPAEREAGITALESEWSLLKHTLMPA